MLYTYIYKINQKLIRKLPIEYDAWIENKHTSTILPTLNFY